MNNYSDHRIEPGAYQWALEVFDEGETHNTLRFTHKDGEQHVFRTEKSSGQGVANEATPAPRAPSIEPAEPSITLNLSQARALVEFFGGEDTEAKVARVDLGHSGAGLYVWCADYPEEGSVLLDAVAPQPPAPEVAEDCDWCHGSGEGRAMAGHGPDTYEIQINCEKCCGSGVLAASQERAVFEAWLGRESFTERSDSGKYVSAHVDAMWSAWQARAALSAPSPEASDIGALEYQGSYVSDIYRRMQEYHDEFNRCWEVLQVEGSLLASRPLHKAIEASLAAPEARETAEPVARFLKFGESIDTHKLCFVELLGAPVPDAKLYYAAPVSQAEPERTCREPWVCVNCFSDQGPCLGPKSQAEPSTSQLATAVINAARDALNDSIDALDTINIPSHLAASLSLCLDEYDRAARTEGKT